jgi:hypothetical protein
LTITLSRKDIWVKFPKREIIPPFSEVLFEVPEVEVVEFELSS